MRDKKVHSKESHTVQLISSEIQSALDAGQPINRDELLRRYPEHSGVIDELLAIEEVLRPGLARSESSVVIGDYLLRREVGRGGMARVFEAEQISLGRTVALKVLYGTDLVSKPLLQRFDREAEAAARLSHPNLVTVFGHGHDVQRHAAYIAMEMVEGRSLAEIVHALRKFDDRKIDARTLLQVAGCEPSPENSVRNKRCVTLLCEWIAQIARGLQIVHDRNVIHRDVKPGNILIRRDGTPVLTDFGLARLEESNIANLTQTGDLIGTPAYMSPEQIDHHRGAVDGRSDVYSLGAALFECLTGQRPFQGETSNEITRRILDDDPPPPSALDSTLPRDLDTIVLKALDKNPDRRYLSARELADDLTRFLQHEPIHARPIGPITRTWKLARRHRGLAGAFALALVLVGGAGVWRAVDRERQRRNQMASAQHHVDDCRRQMRMTSRILDGEIVRDQGSGESLSFCLTQISNSVEALRMLGARSGTIQEIASELCKLGNEARDLHRKLCNEIVLVSVEFRTNQRRYDVGDDTIRRPAELAHLEQRLDLLRLQAQVLFQDAQAAYRLGMPLLAGSSDSGTERLAEATASVYLNLLEFHEELGDRMEASRTERILSNLVGNDSPILRDRREPGRLHVVCEPKDAEIFVFRYDQLSELVDDGEERLVPVAYAWGEEERPLAPDETAGLAPGDLCLVVETVVPGGPAEAAGLQVGDLITHLDGRGIGTSVYAWFQIETGWPRPALLKNFDRLLEIDGSKIHSTEQVLTLIADWKEDPDNTAVLRILARKASGQEVEIPVGAPRRGYLQPLVEEHLLRYCPEQRRPALSLSVVREGRLRLRMDLPHAKDPGLRVWTTSCPLPLHPATRIGVGGVEHTLPAGSYLAVLRAPGFEDLRYPFVIELGEKNSISARLLRKGTTPPGFVYVPPMKIMIESDPLALRNLESKPWTTTGFFVGRDEVSLEEYARFIQSPWIQKLPKTEERPCFCSHLPKQTRPTHFARHQGEEHDTEGYTAAIDIDGNIVSDQRPWGGVRGVTIIDAETYLAWQDVEHSERHHRLLKDEEWEVVGRGADGRAFPWGDTFDWSFFAGWHSTPGNFSYPGQLFPADESPFGVRSLSGGDSSEWVEPLPPKRQGVIRCGSAQHDDPAQFRLGSRFYQGTTQIFGQTSGFRVCFEMDISE